MARRALLEVTFKLLYGPLAPLHEFVGSAAFGPAWAGRRAELLDRLRNHSGVLLDLGCGEGRLLTLARMKGWVAVGVEPSPRMCRRARQAGVTVVRGKAGHIPLRSESVSSVVVTYPGQWITEPETWREIGRVVRPGGSVLLLLGGTVDRGRGSRLRSIVGRIVYGSGRQESQHVALPDIGNGLVRGEWSIENDTWGSVYTWYGLRARESGS